MSLIRKSKRNCYHNLDSGNVTDNKLFWKTVRVRITLTEKDKILGNNKEISKIFNNFFTCIVVKLDILKYEDLSVYSVNSEDPLENIRESG